jgi:hypothetical protein
MVLPNTLSPACRDVPALVPNRREAGKGLKSRTAVTLSRPGAARVLRARKTGARPTVPAGRGGQDQARGRSLSPPWPGALEPTQAAHRTPTYRQERPEGSCPPLRLGRLSATIKGRCDAVSRSASVSPGAGSGSRASPTDRPRPGQAGPLFAGARPAVETPRTCRSQLPPVRAT